ncbi:MAG: hypothetical protein LBB77_04735, partial [Treponema sp.]|nr:hypothetical protein [Treponema sp.]
MKKYLLGGCLIMAAIFSYTACLNPVNFNEEQLPTIHIDGSLDTNNVTRGSTYIVNLSKSLNFTNVVITQTENQALATNEEPYLVSKFPNTKDSTGNWKKVKAKYVQPSDIEYEVEVKIIDGSDEAGPSFSKSTDLLATMPGMVYYIWIYRTKDQAYIDSQIAAGVPAEFADVVVTSPQNPNPPPALPFPSDDDTQNIEVNVGADNGNIVAALERISNTLVNVFVKTGPSTDDENGSVPPVISPANRTAMGTFIVVNLSKTKNIDWVTFHEETAVGVYSNVYTIIPSNLSAPGTTAVAAQDRKGIALKQGSYGITAGYNGTSQTVRKTGIVVPSNDPQAIQEHYIYFYKATNGSYVLSVERPEKGDLDPTDNLPPNSGYHVGIVTIVNKTTSALVNSISIVQAPQPPAPVAPPPPHNRGSMTKDYRNFMPSQPIAGNGRFGSVDFIGTSAFPIDGWFIANVTLLTLEDVVTVQKLIYLNDTIAEIIITDAEIRVNKVPGAKITVTNNTMAAASIIGTVISKIEISNTANPTEHMDFTLAAANNGGQNSFTVLNSPGMPIVENYSYNAKLTVSVTKQFVGDYIIDGTTVRDPLISSTGIVTKSFSPNNSLYGKDGP